MYDLVKDGVMPGQQYLEVMKANIAGETSPDIILDNCRYNVGACINAYIPENRYALESEQVFDLYLNQLIDTLPEKETKELIVEIALDFVTSEAQYKLIQKWFNEGKIIKTNGEQVQGVELQLKAKHTIVKRAHASTFFTPEERAEMIATLETQDKSDWMRNTKVYCKAAIPTAENKAERWAEIFNPDSQLSNDEVNNTVHGFNQRGQSELLAQYHDKFFEKAPWVYKTKQQKQADSIFGSLMPSWKSDERTEGQFRDLLKYAQTEMGEKSGTFAKRIQDTLARLLIKRQARALSQAYLDEQARL